LVDDDGIVVGHMNIKVKGGTARSDGTTLWHMEDIAWILRTDNRKRQVGFVRGRDLDHRERLGLDED